MTIESKPILYQFPLSHFCEKVRWALDHKKIDYQIRNLLPGLHNLTTKKLKLRSQLPILTDGSHKIQGSSAILDYLDQAYPQHSLTPQDPAERAEAEQWERTLDKEIGPYVRCASYHILLDHPDALIKRFTAGGPWYGKPLMKIIFPKLGKMMRAGYKVNPETYAESLTHIDQFIDKLNAHLTSKPQDQQFLVGNQFSRADIAAAALLSPLCSSDDPELPAAYNALRAQYSERLPWVMSIYQGHR